MYIINKLTKQMYVVRNASDKTALIRLRTIQIKTHLARINERISKFDFVYGLCKILNSEYFRYGNEFKIRA